MRVKYVLLSCITTAVCLILLMLVFQGSLALSASGQLDSAESWIDQFDSATLDDRWEWVREDPTHWSLTDRPGFLRFTTQEGSLTENTAKNILLTNPILEDYKITTKVGFSPTENVQNASIIIYQDDVNYFMLWRRYYNGDDVSIFHKFGEGYNFVTVPVSAIDTYLRITKFGDFYVGSYSVDGNNWTDVGQFNASFTDPKVGLMTYNATITSTIPAEIPADFDFFQLNEVGTTWYVAPGVECGDADPCYATIQQAVDAAEQFDTIKVAAGTYDDLNVRPRYDITTTGFVTQVVYLTKSLNLQGGYSPLDWNTPNPQTNPTTLDAQGQGRVIYIAGEISPRIQGFTITGGDAAGLGGWESDDTDCGGGIYVISATTTISDNLINNNQVLNGHGGGAFLAGADTGVASNNIFHTNQAQNGGGISLRDASITIVNNSFRENTGTGSGGGLDLFGSQADLINNLVIGNHSNGSGGGMSMGMFGGPLVSNLIISNTANGDGGGINIFGNSKLTNNTLIDNYAGGSGSALYIQPVGSELVHTTLARNHGGDGSAIYITDGPFGTADVKLINTVFVSHTIGISITAGHTVTVDSVLWYSTPTKLSADPGSTSSVVNEFTGDPAFAADGHHITAGSAAIDKGLDAGILVDVDGEPRPAGAGYDLGADELWIKVYLPVVVNE